MNADLKQKTVKGVMWSLVQRFGVMIISFCANLVLARLLTPDDYGVVGMLLIFISISNTFVDGGFGTALIQKKKPTQEDYSTIFFWNIAISVILTGILYFSSPFISEFYRLPLLADVLKVMGTVLIINAFSAVQTNVLQKNLEFKKLATINIIANAAASILAIVLALNGFGVWSLVLRYLSCSMVVSVILWITTKWKPTLTFKLESFKTLGKFGIMVLLANLVETIYTEFQGLVIGKAFSAKTLGYYTQAKRLEEIPTSGISAAVNQASFPLYAQLQNDKNALRSAVRKYIRALSYLVIPLYFILIIIAESLINILFTEKWNASVNLFRILCFIGMIYPLNTVNTNVIKSLGKGKLYFNLQLWKRVFGIILILLSVRYGLYAMMWALVITAYAIFIVNALFSDKMIGYNWIRQIKDVLIPFAICILLVCIVYPFSLLRIHTYCIAAIQAIAFALGYLTILKITKVNVVKDIVSQIKLFMSK